MKKLIILLIALITVLSLPISALAAPKEQATPELAEVGEKASPKKSAAPVASKSPKQEKGAEDSNLPASPEQPSEGAGSFSIDSENLYEDMDKPYKRGYAPTVKDGRVSIVLPLIASGGIKGNTLTASLELGDPSNAPFVFKTYEKRVRAGKHSVNEGKKEVSAYLIKFTVELARTRYIGTYPVNVKVASVSSSGEPIEQVFSYYVRITDGKDPNATPPPERVKKPTSQPILLVTKSTQSPAPTEAGSEFTLNITLKNTHEKKSVQNMTVKLSCETPGVELLSDSDTFFYEGVEKGDFLNISARFSTSPDTPAGRHDVTVQIAYDNSDAETLSSGGTAAFRITQPTRVELTPPQIAREVNAGDTLPLTLQVMNLSRTAVYNVRLELAAPGLIPSGTGFIGNMEAGTAGTADLSIFVGTKDMSEGYTGDDSYGYTQGSITLIYENASGEEIREDILIDTVINAPYIPETADEPEEEKEQLQWWIAVAAGAAVLAGLAVIFAVKKRKKGQQDEEL